MLFASNFHMKSTDNVKIGTLDIFELSVIFLRIEIYLIYLSITKAPTNPFSVMSMHNTTKHSLSCAS